MIHPFRLAPNWFRRNGCLGPRAKKFLASRTLLRRNSNRLPWNWFVPDFVMTLTTSPIRPNSAEYVALQHAELADAVDAGARDAEKSGWSKP